MKIFYCTDLHGNKKKYNSIPELSKDSDIVIIGADILPKNMDNIHAYQRSFIIKFLPRFLSSVDKPIIIDFGNDDFYCHYSIFKDLVSRFNHVYISHMNSFTVNGIKFSGMHYVPDYPFGLKDWCRADENRYEDVIQFSSSVLSVENGFKAITNLREYFKENINISDALKELEIPDILLTHSPPRLIGLDVCANGKEVGSSAVTNYIIQNNIKLSLHGHIHESVHYSGLSINSLIENSYSIQPGQSGPHLLVYCTFNTDNVSKTYNYYTRSV